MTWPVRSGLVPLLAEGFIARPDTVPGLEAALVPGAAVALVPGEDAGSAPDWPGSSGKTQLATWLAGSLWRSREVDLGVPQSIQSRGQFGFYGSAFMFPAVLLLNVGFIAAELVIQAQAMNGVTAALSIPQWIVILAVPSVVIGIFGYRWIHWVMQATPVVVGVSLVIVFAQGLRYSSLPAHETSMARPAFGLFLAGVALLVIDMLSFGPFVSDYTRYLPRRDQRAAVLGHLRRQRPSDLWLVRGGRLPGRAAAPRSARSPPSARCQVRGRWSLWPCR